MKEKTLTRIRKFTEDRNWDQFHSPANLAKSISIEASELLECFQWNEENFDLQHVKEELADVIIYSQDLLDKLNLDDVEIERPYVSVLRKDIQKKCEIKQEELYQNVKVMRDTAIEVPKIIE